MLRVAEHRRALPIFLSVSGTACAIVSLIHVFAWADVPGGRFFLPLSWMLLTVAGLFIGFPSWWRSLKATKH